MRKLIVFALALALSSSMTLAMDEDAMDEMMEAPAPSVAVGGSGKIGIRNVDDADETGLQLVRAYKVTFDSTGTTDGGLMFGAGISIEDTHDDDPHQSVNGSHVFVGGADGSWKLQFGGNDPGIDLAGGFGVADDHFSGGHEDATVSFSGSFGDTDYRITVSDPGLEVEIPARTVSFNAVENFAARDAYIAAVAAKDSDNDWSVGVSHSINTISVGVGMDSEDGLAIGVGTDLSGVRTFVYWSKSETSDVTAFYNDAVSGANDVKVSEENTGLGIKASMAAGEGASFSVGYSTLKLEQTGTTNTIYNETAKTKQIEIDFSYDLGGGATFEAGIEKSDAEILETDQGGTAVDPKDITILGVAISLSF